MTTKPRPAPEGNSATPSKGLFQVIYGKRWRREMSRFIYEQREWILRSRMHTQYHAKKQGHR